MASVPSSLRVPAVLACPGCREDHMDYLMFEFPEESSIARVTCATCGNRYDAWDQVAEAWDATTE